MIGEYNHTIDAKGRLFVPAKFRDRLGGECVVTKGLDGCLFVYAADAWKELREKIDSLPMSKARNLQRFFMSSASDCQADSQGRILIPSNLRDFAGLTKNATIIGVSNRAEIWDTDRWKEYNDQISAEEIVSAMEELGF